MEFLGDLCSGYHLQLFCYDFCFWRCVSQPQNWAQFSGKLLYLQWEIKNFSGMDSPVTNQWEVFVIFNFILVFCHDCCFKKSVSKSQNQAQFSRKLLYLQWVILNSPRGDPPDPHKRGRGQPRPPPRPHTLHPSAFGTLGRPLACKKSIFR